MQQLWNDMLSYLASSYDLLVIFLPKLILGLIVLFLFLFLARYTNFFLQRQFAKKVDDPLLAEFLAKFTRTSIQILGLLITLWIIGLGGAATSILAGAGISAFVIGFAFKDIGENFLAGILMAFKRPFRLGDIVETGNIKGTIVGLSLRDTQIKTFDGKDVYVPNGAILKNPIINYTIDGFLRQEFDLALDYGVDLEHVTRVIKTALQGVKGILQQGKEPSVAIDRITPGTMNLKIYYWLDTFDKSVSGVEIKKQAVYRTLGAVSAAGIYLPGEVLEVKNYEPAVLHITHRPAQ